jgi:hypothetical protein
LLSNMLEFRLARLLISLPTRLRHYRSLPADPVTRQKPAANEVVQSAGALADDHVWGRAETSRSVDSRPADLPPSGHNWRRPRTPRASGAERRVGRRRHARGRT